MHSTLTAPSRNHSLRSGAVCGSITNGTYRIDAKAGRMPVRLPEHRRRPRRPRYSRSTAHPFSFCHHLNRMCIGVWRVEHHCAARQPRRHAIDTSPNAVSGFLTTTTSGLKRPHLRARSLSPHARTTHASPSTIGWIAS